MAHPVEITVGIITIVVGFIAIFLTVKSRRTFEGGLLNTYLFNYLLALIFLVSFSLWHTTSEYFDLKETIGTFVEYPEYFFIIFAYVAFAFTAYKIYALSKLET